MKKTLFYFTAPWCTGCQSFGPVMDMIAQQGIPVEKINVDYETDRAKSANVISIPTVVLAENGQEIRRFTGVKSLQQVLDFYNQ
jgi:thioredoxin 1